MDVIIGLPFLRWFRSVSMGITDSGRAWLSWVQRDGRAGRCQAQKSHRIHEQPTCSSSHLCSFRDGTPDARWSRRPRTDGPMLPKRFNIARRRGEFTEIFVAHVSLFTPGPPIEVCNIQLRTDGAALPPPGPGKPGDTNPTSLPSEDPLASIPLNHPIRPILAPFRRSLFRESAGLPPDRGEDNFAIELLPGESRPSFQPLRHLGPVELEELRKQIDLLLKKGWIRHSNSPWGAAVLFAKKKDGSLRCCIDYRELNKQTRKDRTPLPRLTELRDRLHGKRYFTAIDIREAYHRIRVRPEDVEKTAFRTRFGHFEYLVMPFGVTNAPAAFQRLTNKLLAAQYDHCVISYLDDILIFSDTLEDHLRDVKAVLTILDKHSLYIKPSKCTWVTDEVEFCGHMVGVGGLRIADSKIKAVTDWATPTHHLDVASFVGLTNYMSGFVDSYSRIALPLTDLQSGSKPWQWGEAEAKAFQGLKDAIASAPVLKAYDPDAEKYVHTDASGFCVSGWFGQPAHPDDHIPSPLPTTIEGLTNLPRLRPVSYHARKMIPAETRYPVHEQELLAVVSTLKANRHYLIGSRFRVFTDHKSLQYLQTQPHLSRRQAGWVELLQEFDFTLEYLPGPHNTVADVLSRQATYAPKCATCAAKIMVAATLLGTPAGPVTVDPHGEAWTTAMECDTFAQGVLADLKAGATGQPDASSPAPGKGLPSGHLGTPAHRPTVSARLAANRARRFTLRGILLYYEDRLYVPLEMRPTVLFVEHDSALQGGHSGDVRTLNKLFPQYYWPNMAADVVAYIRSCDACQRHKGPLRTAGFMRALPIPTATWAQIGVDVAFLPATTRYHGHPDNAVALDCVLVVVDYLSSRWVLTPTLH